MRVRLAVLTAALALPLMAQAPSMAQTPAPSPAPDPAKLALARQLVEKSAGDRDQILAGMSGPMIGFMQQMGVKDPTRARQMVDEAVMPILREHYSELVDIQARSYADTLSADDLKGVLAFYNTTAGADLIKAQPTLARTRVVSMTQWMGTLQPEMLDRIQKTAKSHGWDKAN